MSNSLGSSDSDIGSPESRPISPAGAKQGGISSTQLSTASLRCVTTSSTFGRDFISPSQHFWVKAHSESENPMVEAFAGLPGRSPRST